MKEDRRYLMTEEWYESDIKPHGRLESKVTAYGLRDKKYCKDTIYCMERYSPYDYCDSNTFKSEEEYKLHLRLLEENGARIEYING